MAGRSFSALPLIKDIKQEEGLDFPFLGTFLNNQKEKVYFHLSHHLIHCQKMHIIPLCFFMHLLSLASIHEATVQETDYLLFYICENDSSVLCLFKY